VSCAGTAGSQFQGGNGSINSSCSNTARNRGGGGGGGGYYGGGGATTDINLVTGGGGGGSSYTGGAGLSNASTVAGSGATPGNSSDSDNSGSGTGGGADTAGSNGLVVVYYGAGQVWSISPTSVVATGGGTATINGQGFVSGTTVTIGGNTCSGVTIVSSSQLTCTIPSGSVGSADVVVNVPFAQAATLTSGFTFN
jgi:hypothetical protein